jgi:glycosyltransferase involved in cell wall biosynthesis
MNKGIELASGEFINFMNSDDFFCRNDAVEIVMKAISKSNAQWGYGSANVIDKDTGRLLWPKIGNIPAFLFSSGCPCHQAVFTKTSIMSEKGGFDTSDNNPGVFSDNKIMIELVLEGIIPATIRESIVNYRSGGVSDNSKKEDLDTYTKHLYEMIGRKWGLSLMECRGLYCLDFYRHSDIYGRAFKTGKKYAQAIGRKIQLDITRKYYFKCLIKYRILTAVSKFYRFKLIIIQKRSSLTQRLKWFVKMLLPYGIVRLIQRYRMRGIIK